MSKSEPADGNQVLKTSKVVAVSCVHREVVGRGRGRDHEVGGAWGPWLSAAGDGRRSYYSESTRCTHVECKWGERGLAALEAVLAPTSFEWIARRMRPGREFGQRDGTDGDVDWQNPRFDELKIDSH